MKYLPSPFSPENKDGILVPGTVTSHAKESDVKSSSTPYTCESTVGDRFTYAAVNGQSEVMKALYPNASPKQLKVRGYYVQFPGVKSLKACSTKYTPLAKSYELSISTFLLAVPITYKEDVEVHDIPMHKYVLDKSALEVNNVTVFTRGIFDVTRVMKGPIYASLPGFLHGDPSLYKELDLNAPETEKYESFLSVEPISGTAMHLKLRIQLNGKILDSSLSPSYPGTKNVTFLNKQIPISWTETEAIIDPETAKEYSSQLFGGLRLSCGLLVALPVIGGILVILGVVFIVLAVKKSDSVTAA
ncbi:sensory neuron membrane protein 1-like [Oculina patagonica]